MFIRDQDGRLQEFVAANSVLQTELAATRGQVGEARQREQELRDQNSILQAQAINTVTTSLPVPRAAAVQQPDGEKEVAGLRETVGRLQARLGQQEEYVLELEARLGGLETNEEEVGEVVL